MLTWDSPPLMIHCIRPPTSTEISTVVCTRKRCLCLCANHSCRRENCFERKIWLQLYKKKYCKSSSTYRRKTYAAINIYALRIRLTPELSRIAAHIARAEQLPAGGCFAQTAAESPDFWREEAFKYLLLLWCCRPRKRAHPYLDQQRTLLFNQWDFLTLSAMWILAVIAEMKEAIKCTLMGRAVWFPTKNTDCTDPFVYAVMNYIN